MARLSLSAFVVLIVVIAILIHLAAVMYSLARVQRWAKTAREPADGRSGETYRAKA